MYVSVTAHAVLYTYVWSAQVYIQLELDVCMYRHAQMKHAFTHTRLTPCIGMQINVRVISHVTKVTVGIKSCRGARMCFICAWNELLTIV